MSEKIKFETIINNQYNIQFLTEDEICDIQEDFIKNNIFPDEVCIKGKLINFLEAEIEYPDYTNYRKQIDFYFDNINSNLKNNIITSIIGFWGQKLATYYAMGDLLLNHSVYNKKLFINEINYLIDFCNKSYFDYIDLINDSNNEIIRKFEEYRDDLYDYCEDLYEKISINLINLVLYLQSEIIEDSICVNRSFHSDDNYDIDFSKNNFFKSFTFGESYYNIGKESIGFSGYDMVEYFILPKYFPVIRTDIADPNEILLNIRDVIKLKPNAIIK